MPLKLVILEELGAHLKPLKAATLVTVRYFVNETDAALQSIMESGEAKGAYRVIPIDIYNYSQELEMIKGLAEGARLGLVSLSSGTLEVAEVMINSLRGDEIFVMSAPSNNRQKLNAVIRQSQLIISDQASCQVVKEAIAELSQDIIRIPKLVCCENYIDPNSIKLLRLELGMDDSAPPKKRKRTKQQA